MARHRSSAAPLAWSYAALIVYASLYPFSGWRVPGVSPFAFLMQPWPHAWFWFDLVSNLVGYLPFGALVFGARVRAGAPNAVSLALAIAAGVLLSLAMEFLQNYLPRRVASNVDLAVNALGTVLGAALGAAAHRRGWVDQWQRARDRWFIGRSAGGLALLLLWPVGLLFPDPVPLGLGQVMGELHDLVDDALEGSPAAAWLSDWPAGAVDAPPLSPAGELAAVALGLLAPSLIAFTISRRGWTRLVLVAGAATLGIATTTLSTALNFGPQHALAWTTPGALAGLAVGAVLALLLSQVPRRGAAGLALVALTALVMLVGNAPADPYFAQSLQAWEQGRFIRFHGAAQWVGWFWPYAAIVYLLVRITARDEAAPDGRSKITP